MRTALVWILRVGLAAVMLIAGALKFREPTVFATEIANYQLFPTLAPILAATLPVTEMLLGAALVVTARAWRRAAAAGSFALMAMFLVAVASAYFRGIDIACGCFGGGGESITALTLVRGAGLVGAAAALFFLEGDAQVAGSPHISRPSS